MSIRPIGRLIPLLLLLVGCSLTNGDDVSPPPTNTGPPQTPVVLTPAATLPPAADALPTATPLLDSSGQADLPACDTPDGWVPYTVVSGDTLGGIAESTGTTAEQLASGNCLVDADTILAGSVLYVPNVGQGAGSTCPLAPRLVAGGQGQVTYQPLIETRAQPTRSSAVVDQIPAGSVFSVVSGPTCAEGSNWWQISFNGRTGWTQEGDATQYFVAPSP